jgi:hypothetical protein
MLQVVLCASTARGQNFGDWSPAVSIDPNRLLVNTSANDGCPIEAPDGLTLFFASNRTVNGQPNTLLDIWVAFRASEDEPWSEIERLPGPVNTGANEFCPTPLPGNRLMFVSTRTSPCSGPLTPPTADIYLTQHHPVHGWLEPKPLCGVNSTFDEFSPSFVEAGQSVRKGQVVCIVEAMKLMNEIEAEAEGKIEEILVQNGEHVEYGQHLFRLSK